MPKKLDVGDPCTVNDPNNEYHLCDGEVISVYKKDGEKLYKVKFRSYAAEGTADFYHEQLVRGNIYE